MLNNVTLKFGEKSMNFEVIIIAEAALILAESLDYIGNLYGFEKDNVWGLHEEDYKSPVDNPLKKQQEQILFLREIFPKENIYNVKIDNYVVFLGKDKYFSYYGKSSACITYKKFKKLLNSDKYKSSGNLKPDLVKKALEKYI